MAGNKHRRAGHRTPGGGKPSQKSETNGSGAQNNTRPFPTDITLKNDSVAGVLVAIPRWLRMDINGPVSQVFTNGSFPSPKGPIHTNDAIRQLFSEMQPATARCTRSPAARSTPSALRAATLAILRSEEIICHPNKADPEATIP